MNNGHKQLNNQSYFNLDKELLHLNAYLVEHKADIKSGSDFKWFFNEKNHPQLLEQAIEEKSFEALSIFIKNFKFQPTDSIFSDIKYSSTNISLFDQLKDLMKSDTSFSRKFILWSLRSNQSDWLDFALKHTDNVDQKTKIEASGIATGSPHNKASKTFLEWHANQIFNI